MDRSPGRTRPPREEVRAALLHAAAAEFDAKGFGGATVESIAARAGFTKGAVYGNFDGKFGLFLELLAQQSAAISARFEPAALPPEDVDAALRGIAELIVDLTVDPHRQLLLAEVRGYAARVPEHAAALGAHREELVDALTDNLVSSLARLGLTLTVAPREATYLMLALSNGVALEHVGTPGPVVSAATVYRLLRAVMA